MSRVRGRDWIAAQSSFVDAFNSVLILAFHRNPDQFRIIHYDQAGGRLEMTKISVICKSAGRSLSVTLKEMRERPSNLPAKW